MEKINAICSEIVSRCDPHKVYLFGKKTTVLGAVKSADFCIICNTSDKKSLSSKLFLEIDSEIPFSIVIYNNDEWIEFKKDETSFAARIAEKGSLIYEKES